MTNTLLVVLGVIVVLFIAVKIFKSIVKGIIILIVIVAAIMFFNNVSNGTLSLDTIKSIFPTQV